MKPSGFDATAESSSLHVSLANELEPAINAALEDAVAKLAAVTSGAGLSDAAMSGVGLESKSLAGDKPVAGRPPKQQPATSDPRRGTEVALRLIEAMAVARSRRDAMKLLVATLSTLCPGATVRAAIGRTRLNLFLDHRLGWLGPESSLQQQAVAKWNRPTGMRSGDVAGRGESAAGHDEQSIAPENNGSQPTTSDQNDPTQLNRASLRKTDDGIELRLPSPDGIGNGLVWIEGTPGEIEWLPAAALAINAVFWSRPSRALPTLATGMIKRSTIGLAIAGILVVAAALWPVPYRVKCDAIVETIHARFIATPFEATLLKADVRPGDVVRAGQPLLVLDGRPLRLEREALSAEIGQVSKEYDVALASRKIAEAQQAELRRKQLTRKLDLITDRLANLTLTSPIDGVVVSGDLERHVGTPLELGQTLIEVAPLSRVKCELHIPEHEVSFVDEGQPTRLRFHSVGGPSIHVTLEELHPKSELRDDQNVFVGQIDLDNSDGHLRPGMKGDAIIYGPLRPRIWSWIRGGFQRLLWWVGY